MVAFHVETLQPRRAEWNLDNNADALGFAGACWTVLAQSGEVVLHHVSNTGSAANIRLGCTLNSLIYVGYSTKGI